MICTSLIENGLDVGDGIELATEAKFQSDPHGTDSARGERGNLGMAHLTPKVLHEASGLLAHGNVPYPARKSQSAPDFPCQ